MIAHRDVDAPPCIEVFGRSDSSAVARVMWTIGELGLPSLRHDVGGALGGTRTREYLALNPTGRVPAVRLSNGRSLWESNAIIRYLARVHGEGRLSPEDPTDLAEAEAWMDWSADYQKAVGGVRKAYKRDPATLESMQTAMEAARPSLEMLERRLEGRDFVMGGRFTISDLSLGVWTHRWMRTPPDLPDRPDLPATEAWWRRLCMRPAYVEHVVARISAGPQQIAN